MNRRYLGAILLVATSLLSLHAGCMGPQFPDSTSCRVIPPQTADARATQEQAAKLNAKVVNAPVEGGAEAEQRAEVQINETYQAVSDKQAACAMLFQTIECLERDNRGGPLAAKLSDNVVALCTAPAAPARATAAPEPTAPPPAYVPASSPSPGVTQCSIASCGVARSGQCSITCASPKQAKCSCDTTGGSLGLPLLVKENCRCE